MSVPPASASRSRDLRDRPLGRIALLLAVLALAFLSVRACQPDEGVSSERAVELARAEADFTPDRTQVRLVQQGIPPRAYWAVSLYNVDGAGRPTEFVAFLVDRRTGEVVKTR